jgi:hypothetical protein
LWPSFGVINVFLLETLVNEGFVSSVGNEELLRFLLRYEYSIIVNTEKERSLKRERMEKMKRNKYKEINVKREN